ncbi:MAG: hypothetical protein M1821_002274 [Bathelium mastoideum]|nr:MAG: hypothetical protein M1821_002274 [Bathelium mastoideum]KAI9685776.1 MAG: hypothetical protein M1822_004336 [Bathelium mastoideum]
MGAITNNDPDRNSWITRYSHISETIDGSSSAESSADEQEHRAQRRSKILKRYGSIADSPLNKSSDHANQKPPKRTFSYPPADASNVSIHFNGSAAQPSTFLSHEQVNPTNSRKADHPYFWRCLKPNQDTGKSNSKIAFASSVPEPARRERPLSMGMMSLGTFGRSRTSKASYTSLDANREAELRRAAFYNFLDKELAKIGSFYKEKEDEATHRLLLLEEQLQVMREQRVEEVMSNSRSRTDRSSQSVEYTPDRSHRGENTAKDAHHSRGKGILWDVHRIGGILSSLQSFKFGSRDRSSTAAQVLQKPHTVQPNHHLDLQHDYSSRTSSVEVPYRTAKRKLETAMVEYYHSLELLKSFSIFNRRAFQKITKKYDKLVRGHSARHYMSEKVDSAYFVKSNVLQNHIRTVEDLYARDFEHGNRKVAVKQLRAGSYKQRDYSACVFRSGLLFATGLIFGIQGLMCAISLLSSPDAVRASETYYLLQVDTRSASNK